MNMKEKLTKMLEEKRAQETTLHDGLINGETKEERAAIGETLAALRKEIADIESVLAELDEPAAGEGEGEGARGLNILAMSGGEQRGKVDPQAEYRSAWLKNLQGAELTDGEKRALTSANSGAVIPVETQNKILTKVKEVVPLLDKIELLHVAGNVSFVVEGIVNDAEGHDEGAAVTASEDTTVTVDLTGYEIIKLVTISAKVKTMSINAFEDWLTEQLGRKVAEKIEQWIIAGTGTKQPKGIVNAVEWTDGTNMVTFEGAAATAEEMAEVISLLPSRHAREAAFLMSRKTFWGKIMPARDDKTMPVVAGEGAGEYKVFGYPVELSDFVPANEFYFGNPRMIVANLADDIEVTSSEASGFRSNTIDYRGTAIFDSQLADEAAFVKGSFTA